MATFFNKQTINYPNRILVHSIFYHPDMIGISKYTGEMVNWLVEKGSVCTVITTYPFYPQWKVPEPYNNFIYKKEVNTNLSLTIYRCPAYIPASPSPLKRILHEFSFFISSLPIFIILLFKKRFDLLISIAPPFHLAFLAIFYRSLKNTKIVYHIQDLQIDIAKDMSMIKSKKLLSFLDYSEKYIISKVDIVSSISEGMINKIKSKVNRSVFFFPNWVDTDLFYPIANQAYLKEIWGFTSSDKIVLYSGNLGQKQGLEEILFVAQNLQSKRNLKFIICGDGAYKETLTQLAEQLKLKNVTFLPLQETARFNQFLNIADIHLLLQKKDASDLVMPSKLVAILAVGGFVIVTANIGTTLYNVISNHSIGIVINPENTILLTEVIQKYLDENTSKFRNNARQYAKKHLSREHILDDFIQQVS